MVGFNHNVKYGPRVYHVQTEDSGLPHAHYITHLFVGGNIVASMKTSYSDKAHDPDVAKLVRGLMESQHKAMLKRLVTGEFNETAERLSATHYDPGVLADGSNQATYVNTTADHARRGGRGPTRGRRPREARGSGAVRLARRPPPRPPHARNRRPAAAGVAAPPAAPRRRSAAHAGTAVARRHARARAGDQAHRAAADDARAPRPRRRHSAARRSARRPPSLFADARSRRRTTICPLCSPRS